MNRNQSIICEAKSIGVSGKHAGSKPIKRLQRLLGQNASSRYWHKKAQEARENR